MSKTRTNALNKFKSHPLESILIGLFTGLLMAAVTLLGLISPLFFIIIIPFMFLPLFFSGYFTHLSLNFDDKISFGNSFKFFGLFFKHPFRNSFKGIISFAKALLIGIITFTSLTTIISFVLTYTNQEFPVLLEEFYTLLETSETISYEALETLLNSHNGLLNNMITWSFVPAVGVGFLAFIYFITYNSLTIYIKINIQSNNSSIYPYLLKQANILSDRKIVKDFWALNWPMLLLGLLGFTGTTVGFYFLNYFDYFQLAICGIVGGLVLIVLYLPMFFNNMEAISDVHADTIKKASEELNKNMLEQLQNSLRISKEQQEEIQKALNELNKQNDNIVDESEKSEEEKDE